MDSIEKSLWINNLTVKQATEDYVKDILKDFKDKIRFLGSKDFSAAIECSSIEIAYEIISKYDNFQIENSDKTLKILHFLEFYKAEDHIYSEESTNEMSNIFNMCFNWPNQIPAEYYSPEIKESFYKLKEEINNQNERGCKMLNKYKREYYNLIEKTKQIKSVCDGHEEKFKSDWEMAKLESINDV